MVRQLGIAAVVGAALAVSGCTASVPTVTATPSSVASQTLPLAGTPDQICRARFPATTLAMATSYGSALHAGTSGPDVTGKGAYHSDQPAVQCLVKGSPTLDSYAVEVIILSDGTVLTVGSQSHGGSFDPRA